jgi:excisionase family DNA binding protein
MPAGRKAHQNRRSGGLTSQRALADFLGVSRHTLLRWRRQGITPPAIKIGNTVRFRTHDVQAWLKQRQGA